MTALTRGVAVSVAVGKLACTEPGPPLPPPQPASSAPASSPPPPAPAPVAVPEPPPPPSDPSPALAYYKVTNTSFARRVLYTWTTTAQVEELLRTRVLLSRTQSPLYGRSHYDRVMEARWRTQTDKLASLLRADAFQKNRFAWPAAWATFLGWPGEKYGDQLVEVTLRKEALIAMYRTSVQKWEVRDLSDAVVPEAEALRHPERIGAVLFVHDAVSLPSATATPRPSAGDGREAYREYVLCNEAMIESWAVGTDSVMREITAGADAVEAAAKHFAASPVASQRSDRWNAHVALLVWPGIVPASGPKELYEAALAFPNTNYLIDPEPLRVLALTLRAMRAGGPGTVHRPIFKFPGAKAPPIPPPPPPPPRPVYRKGYGGTF